MIASVDGKATIEGTTRALGSETDRQLFRNLRTQADAVMAGAGTVRTERYGRIVRDPLLREKRQAEGLAPDPLAVIVSGSLDLDADLPLLQDPDSTVVFLTAAGRSLEGCMASVDYIRAGGQPLRLAQMLGLLRTEYGVRSILCEGGPTLNAFLLAEDLVDELFLTVAPKLSAGGATTIAEGHGLDRPLDCELVSVLYDRSSLFARYRVEGFKAGPAG